MNIILQLSLAIVFITAVKPVATLAQEHSLRSPVYDEIKKRVLDSESLYYYPDILQRFLNQDTTQSVDDFYYLYDLRHLYPAE